MNRRRRRSSGRGLFASCSVGVGLLVALLLLPVSLAAFSATTQNTGNSMGSDTLDPPTGLTATGGGDITLNWTATSDTYASGHSILRSTTPGGPYVEIAAVSPRTTVTYVDSPPDGTYYYVVRAFTAGWESAASNEASAVVTTVQLVDSWQSGLTHVAGAGTDRLLVFVASNEQQSEVSRSLSSVTYGGQPMTRVVNHEFASFSKMSSIEFWVLGEAGIAAASSTTIVPTWNAGVDVPLYSHAIFSSVDQTTPAVARVVGATTGDVDLVPLAPLATSNGDMVVGFATAGEAGYYAPENGYTVGLNQFATVPGSTAQGTAQKSATGADETFATRFIPASPPWINRQVAGAVVLHVAP